MTFHGRYRVVRRPPADLRLVDGVWTLHDGESVFGWFSRQAIEQVTGMSPEENAAGGWRCFWQETPRNGLERR